LLAPAERWAAKTRTVNLHGGNATRSKAVSFLDNELREGVFRTFGFLKPKRLFSRIKLVTKNATVGTMLRRRRSCKKKQLQLKLLEHDADDTVHEASEL
jgi:hypothetical protein